MTTARFERLETNGECESRGLHGDRDGRRVPIRVALLDGGPILGPVVEALLVPTAMMSTCPAKKRKRSRACQPCSSADQTSCGDRALASARPAIGREIAALGQSAPATSGQESLRQVIVSRT